MIVGLCNFTPAVGQLIFLDLSVTSPLLLENLFPFNYQNRTTNVLTKYCKVFSLGFCCYFVKCILCFLAWIGLSSHWKPLCAILRAHSRVSAWFPNILFRGINFPLNNVKCFLRLKYYTINGLQIKQYQLKVSVTLKA